MDEYSLDYIKDYYEGIDKSTSTYSLQMRLVMIYYLLFL